MIPNKDLCIDSENGKIVLNGDKYDLGTQGEIDTAVKDVYSVMGQNGAKNLIPYPYYETTKEVNGVVVTDNGDGTITVNGTASASATVFKYLSNDSAIEIPLERRKYKLTFGTDQGSNGFHLGDCRLVKTDSTTQTKNVTGDTIIDNTNGDYIGINAMSVYVAKDKAVNNVTIYPMLRLAEDTDNTYQPYAMTNKQLTEQVATKQDTLTFDNAPTASSDNPVKSGGIKTFVDNTIKSEYVSGNIATLDANSRTTLEIALTIPNGYSALGITSAFTSSSNVGIVGYLVNSSTGKLNLVCANLSASTVSGITVAATCIYLRQ